MATSTSNGRTPFKTSVITTVQTSTKAATKTAVKKATKTASKTATKANTYTNKTVSDAAVPTDNQKVTLRGRSVFLVQTTAAGVTVRTAWMSEDKKLMDMPAVFPDVNYAINLIDDLKRQVLKHFSQAAQVGGQVIAQQKRAKGESSAS